MPGSHPAPTEKPPATKGAACPARMPPPPPTRRGYAARARWGGGGRGAANRGRGAGTPTSVRSQIVPNLRSAGVAWYALQKGVPGATGCRHRMRALVYGSRAVEIAAHRAAPPPETQERRGRSAMKCRECGAFVICGPVRRTYPTDEPRPDSLRTRPKINRPHIRRRRHSKIRVPRRLHRAWVAVPLVVRNPLRGRPVDAPAPCD
jgi:hypothetical protein